MSEDQDDAFSMGPKMHIRKVIVKGNERTRNHVFERELVDAYEAEHIGEVVAALESSVMALSSLAIFEAIKVKLDKGRDSKDDEVDIIIEVREKKWRKLRIGATTDGSDETAESSCSLLNALGGAETLTLSASYGRTGSNTETATFTQPRILGLPFKMIGNVANEVHSHEAFSSFHEKIRSASVALADDSGGHELSLHCAWRDVIPKRDPKKPTVFHASPSILSQAYPTTKTSIRYNYCNDTRDHPVQPCFGSLTRFSSEFAGFYGDVGFMKADITTQNHKSFGPLVFGLPLLNLSFTSRLGALKTYKAGFTSHICDRFFIGGPLSLRGFHFNGIGPRAAANSGIKASGDALGGDVFYTASAHIGFPLPIPTFAAMGFRGHVFASLGNLTTWDRTVDKRRWLRNLVYDTRVSTGLGIVLPTNFGRLEANYSWILNAATYDNIRRCQLGIGMTFT